MPRVRIVVTYVHTYATLSVAITTGVTVMVQVMQLDADNIEDELPDIFVPNVDNGLSNEDYDIIFRQRHPIISQWKDSPAPQYGNVSAIIALPENGASFSYSY